MNNNWTVLTYPVTIDKAMDYKILFAWRNNSYGGSQPPFAVDDVTISYVPCFKPMVSYDSITSTSADILIHIDGNSSLLKLSSTPIAEASLDTTVADGYDGILNVKRYRWSSLVPDTEYYVYVRGICPTGDTTLWSSSSFRTACKIGRAHV